MTTRIVTLEQLSGQLKDFGKATLEHQKKAVVRGLYRSLPGLVKDSPVDTGLYAQSWKVTEQDNGAIIGNTAPHAAVIEYGARPFTPPIAPLLAWAKRVLRNGSQPPNYDSQVWGLAKGVQKKISVYGMKPHRVLFNALPKIVENIGHELKAVQNGR